MKIVCDSCSTKYSISDDKVRGKVFKIRCKKCSHIIVVRGTADAATVAAPAPAPASASASAPVAADAVWHIVVDGDQVGPITDTEVRARLARGEISTDSYIWREGFADWLKLSSVPEFASVAASVPSDAAPATDNERTVMQPTPEFPAAAAPPAAAAEPAPAPADDPFAAQPSDDDNPFAAAATRKPAEKSEDVFSAPAPAARRPSAADLFASPAPSAEPAPAARTTSGGGAGAGVHVMNEPAGGLTGQRHENSVLFSLSNLQSLAMPAGGGSSSPRPGMAGGISEGSGLIDIRSMAASTLGGGSSAGGDDLPAFGTAAFTSPMSPVLLSSESSSGLPKWVYPLVGLMAVLVLGIGVMAYFLLKKPPQPTVVEKVVTVEKTVPAVVAPPPAAIKAEDLPPREAPGPVAAATPSKDREKDKDDKGKGKSASSSSSSKSGSSKSGKGSDSKSASGGSAVAAAAPEPKAAAPAKSDEPKKPKSELDSLLDRAMGGGPSRPSGGEARRPAAAAAPVEAKSSGPLAKEAVVAGMNSVKPRVKECYNQFKVPGTAMVNIVIGKSGSVSSATVTGALAGTPSGACVEKAVKSARFPPSDGLTTMYPFQLR